MLHSHSAGCIYTILTMACVLISSFLVFVYSCVCCCKSEGLIYMHKHVGVCMSV